MQSEKYRRFFLQYVSLILIINVFAIALLAKQRAERIAAIRPKQAAQIQSPQNNQLKSEIVIDQIFQGDSLQPDAAKLQPLVSLLESHDLVAWISLSSPGEASLGIERAANLHESMISMGVPAWASRVEYVGGGQPTIWAQARVRFTSQRSWEG